MTCFLSFFPSLDRTAAHKDVCFTRIEEGWICSEPQNRVVTYSECCCHFGRGWGPECNSCPPRNSGELLKTCQTSLALNPFINKNFICFIQQCSAICVGCILRRSQTGNRICRQLFPTTTRVTLNDSFS